VRTGASAAHYIWVGRAVVLALLVIGYALAIHTFDFLVVLVALSGAGALQLAPGVVNVCFPTRRMLTKAGVLAGIASGLTTFFFTIVVWENPLGVHGSVWAIGTNVVAAFVISGFTKRPSPETVSRIHGEMERFVYGE
jgi:Na+/proline symporter